MDPMNKLCFRRCTLLCTLLCAVLSLALRPVAAWAQARPLAGADVPQIYQHLLPQIEKIAIFDHHAHPGFFDDPDVDAMAAPPGSFALRDRETNPELVAAAKALFGYPYSDTSPEHARWLIEKKAELKKSQGEQYFSRILDRLNIEQSVANRAQMAAYLSPILSCGPSTIGASAAEMATKRFTFRCRRRCCTAFSSRKR
jgi:hypothetical protein